MTLWIIYLTSTHPKPSENDMVIVLFLAVYLLWFLLNGQKQCLYRSWARHFVASWTSENSLIWCSNKSSFSLPQLLSISFSLPAFSFWWRMIRDCHLLHTDNRVIVCVCTFACWDSHVKTNVCINTPVCLCVCVNTCCSHTWSAWDMPWHGTQVVAA